MEQLRRYLQPDEGWVKPDDRALPPHPRTSGGGSGRSRRDDGPPPVAQRRTREDDSSSFDLGAGFGVGLEVGLDVGIVAPERAGRMAALRRAIVLSEVIGPPRALRRDGDF